MQRISWFVKATVLLALMIFILVAVIIEFSILQGYTSDEIIYETVLTTKEDLLKGHVDRTIDEIIFLNEDMIFEGTWYSQLMAKNIALDISELYLKQVPDMTNMTSVELVITNQLSDGAPIFKDMGVLVYQASMDHILFSTDNYTSYTAFLASSEVWPVFSSYEEEGIRAYVYMESEHIDTIVKERVKDWIRKLRIEGSGYVWVNEVVNYDGGQDYAIRLVHPNLPETEGILLSTETEDIKGNRPYKTELEGINNNGEIFFTYFFKEFESDDISEKMTYAKIYEPFNWIIATGIYINEIEAVKEAENFYTNRTILMRILMFVSSVVLIIVVILGWRLINKASSNLIEEKVRHEMASSQMQEKLDYAKDIANEDDLTKLLNRRGIIKRLEEELHRYKRQKYDLVVVMADVDYFKNINDSYGHDFGDKALIHIANMVTRHIRREDIVGRLGGDEFLYIMPYTTVDNAKIITQNIGDRLSEECLEYNGERVCLNLSVGITQVTLDDDVDAIIKRADIAMYQSKRSGKNKISVFSKNEHT